MQFYTFWSRGYRYTATKDTKIIVYANCYSTTNLVFEIHQISHSNASKSESQGVFKPSIEDKNLNL